MSLIAQTMLAAALGASPHQDLPRRSPTVYHGRENRTAVLVPRGDDGGRVDGELDEAMWAEAAILTGFSQYRPLDGLPAADSTEVLIWYSDHAMHFGVRAFESHAPVNASLADRDRISADDQVQLMLDTYHDRRAAFVFAVNPLGVQADGIWNESSAGRHGDESDKTDLSPDFVFESKGRITEWGYQIEIRIPFKSIRYQSIDPQTWGVNIVRRVQHSGHQQTWTQTRRGANSFLAQSGTLVDLTSLRRGLVLDINPVVTARADGAPGAVQGWDYDASRPDPGVNVRWGVNANLTMNGTINPDFSQVESDAGQLTFDPRQALFFAEKRPFFLEASENFVVPNQLVYTRRIAAPVAAAKFTGKVSGTDVGVLSAVDDDAGSPTGSHPVYNIVRLRRDIGAGSTAGLVYTDRVEGDHYNRVAAADARLVFGGVYSLLLQGGASFTRTQVGTHAWRPIFEAAATRRGRAFSVNALLEGTHDEFRAASGFIGRAGIARVQLRPSYTVYGQPGATIESWTGSLNIDGTWLWDGFVDGRAPDDQKLHLGSTFVLRGGWRVNTQFLLESFKYPAELYTHYYIDTGTDTIPYTGRRRIPNYDLLLSVATPQYPTFSADAFVVGGRDENFFEWAPAWVLLGTLNAGWRPTEKLRVDGRYVIQGYWRYDDGTLVSLRQIPRIKFEYQVSRPVFVRLVGEYDASRQDDLRDASRTELPVLLCDRGGVPTGCRRALGFDRGRFRADWLFSWQPTPGTVFFAGYGTSLASDDGFTLLDLRRASDGFFLKFSYLFRM